MRTLLDGFVNVGEVRAEAGYGFNDTGSVRPILNTQLECKF